MSKVKDAQKELSLIITSEDLTILRQRILLLEKQWQEHHNQVILRKQRVGDRLNEWVAICARYKEMIEWLTSMESKVMSNTEYHIEDLIVKLQKDYQDEINDMRVNKDDLIDQGTRLVNASSDIRANDIKMKISHLREKWKYLEDLCVSR
jgi:nesprin-1